MKDANIGMSRLFRILASKFLELPFLRTQTETAGGRTKFTPTDDLDLGLYYLRSLSNILRWAPDTLWAVLAKKTVASDSEYPHLAEISKLSLSIALPRYKHAYLSLQPAPKTT